MSCDIIIPVWNQLKFTKDCLDSICKNTDYPYSLVLIDNNSDNETRCYLEDFSKKNKGAIFIKNKENEGFVKAVNKGISASSSEYLCIMNNDTVATDGWLGELIEVLEKNPLIGLLNPSSNNLGIYPQKNEPMEIFAKRLKIHKGLWTEINSAIGFCMVYKRALTRKIGLFDEVYGMGNFEDTDYSRKAQAAGFKCAMARASYVWHEQNSSFRLLKKFDRSFKYNRKIFEGRWGAPERVLYIFGDSDKKKTHSIPDEATESLNKGNWATIFKIKDKDIKNIPEHGGVKVKSFLGNLFLLKVFFKIIFKKKRFTSIYSDDLNFKKILQVFKPIHKAKVFYINSKDKGLLWEK